MRVSWPSLKLAMRPRLLAGCTTCSTHTADPQPHLQGFPGFPWTPRTSCHFTRNTAGRPAPSPHVHTLRYDHLFTLKCSPNVCMCAPDKLNCGSYVGNFTMNLACNLTLIKYFHVVWCSGYRSDLVNGRLLVWICFFWHGELWSLCWKFEFEFSLQHTFI